MKNAGALPEWLQYEKDIERERKGVFSHRERGLRAVRFARNQATRERVISQLRAEQRERVDLVNTLILKYSFIAPTSMQKAMGTLNLKREMAALEEAISDACRA